MIEDADQAVEDMLDDQIDRLTRVKKHIGSKGCSGVEIRLMPDGAEKLICHDILFGEKTS